MVSLIVAVSSNGVIGFKGHIPWMFKEDFSWFRTHTLGKVCVMGRKTYDSIIDRNGQPLPDRTSVVITSSAGMDCPYPNAFLSLSDVMMEYPDIVVIGGSQLYAEALPQVDRIYLTRVRKHYSGDRFFRHDLTSFEIKEHTRSAHSPLEYFILERPK